MHRGVGHDRKDSFAGGQFLRGSNRQAARAVTTTNEPDPTQGRALLPRVRRLDFAALKETSV